MNSNVHSATTINNRIVSSNPLIKPGALMEKHKLDQDTESFIINSRQLTSDIIHLRSGKLLVVTGPCSIHNPDEALKYAGKLEKLKRDCTNLHIIMRTYFEKPRTSVGWKGLINDPHLDGSFDIEHGLDIARELLLKINKMGIPVSTEFLDTISPHYVSDLITWGAIGARTTESQLHRELTSGLSPIVGYKNGTKGNIDIAINAIKSSLSPHHFLGTNEQGEVSIISTAGNADSHLILRGGSDGPNYDPGSVNSAIEQLENAGIDTGVMIDFSHDNSKENGQQNYQNQFDKVCPDVANQIREGNQKIVGVMIESNLVEGNQSYDPMNPDHDISQLTPGQSITDACVDFDYTTTQMLHDLDSAVGERNQKK